MPHYEYLELPRYDGKKALKKNGEKRTFAELLALRAKDGWRVHSVVISQNSMTLFTVEEISSYTLYLLERVVE